MKERWNLLRERGMEPKLRAKRGTYGRVNCPATRVAIRGKNHTYFAQDKSSGLIKIGRSLVPEIRAEELHATLLKSIPIDIENRCHREFFTSLHHGEWYNPTDALMSFIASLS